MEVIEKPPPAQPQGEDQKSEQTPEQQAEQEREQRRQKQRRPVLDEEGLEGWEHLSYFQRRYGGWSGFFLGPAVRFVLGALLLTGCLIWAKQNELLPTSDTSSLVTGEVHRSIDQTSGSAPVNAVGTSNVIETRSTPQRETEPLQLAILPNLVSDWFTSWNPGIAGLLLIISAFFKGPKLGLFIVPAGLIAVVGVMYLPAVAGIPPVGVSLIVAGILSAVGFNVARG